MNDQNIYVINTGALFQALNVNRKNNNLTEIDNPVIASKLGILFALKTNGYVNFKNEFIELNDIQLIDLQEIIDQHFNANMTYEIRALVRMPEDGPANESEISTNEIRPFTPSVNSKKGFFHRITGFLKHKNKVQPETLA